jgi:hypothetical protein
MSYFRSKTWKYENALTFIFPFYKELLGNACPLIITHLMSLPLSWAEKDSNLRTLARTDLQSVAFNHSAICPSFTCSGNEAKTEREPKKGVEPPTY